MIVLAPAHRCAVRAETTCVLPTTADTNERLIRRIRLSIPVHAPAYGLSIRTKTTSMESTATDGGENFPGWRYRHQVRLKVSPANYAAIGA